MLPDNDAWLNASRYGTLSAVEGLPMMFYGQEQGIQNYNTTPRLRVQRQRLPGRTRVEFRQVHPQLQAVERSCWCRSIRRPIPRAWPTGAGTVNRARLNSPALRSPNRWFLSRTAASRRGDLGNLFAVAKYDQPAVGPAGRGDVVLAFSLLLPHGRAHGTAAGT
ncbi:MAG: hypothetical protein U1F77_07055 [Kiritimatiellia bacterium]